MTAEPTKPAPPRSRRRWLRFSMRTLFVLVALAAIFPARALYRAERQRQAVEHVLSLGGEVNYEHQYENGSWKPDRAPPRPQWLLDLFGVDLFAQVRVIRLLRKTRDLNDDDLKRTFGVSDWMKTH